MQPTSPGCVIVAVLLAVLGGIGFAVLPMQSASVQMSTEEAITAVAVTPVPTAANGEMSGDSSANVTGNDAANADVTQVRAVQTGADTWTFHVTVEHPDTGWEDYADGWDIVLPDGTVVKPNPDDAFTRVLLHPHENEQPFTRSQSDIVIPPDVTQVTVRAHDLVDGFGGQTVTVDLTTTEGENYVVERTDS